MRSNVLSALIGIGVAVVLVAVLGAAFGAVVGIPIYGTEYMWLKGLDGALAGVAVFLLWGGLPAAVVGAVGGVLLARRKPARPDS